MATDKRGVSALLLQRQLGLQRYETAWMMLHKFRRAISTWHAIRYRAKLKLTRPGLEALKLACGAAANPVLRGLRIVFQLAAVFIEERTSDIPDAGQTHPVRAAIGASQVGRHATFACRVRRIEPGPQSARDDVGASVISL
jgi:hypothetical protein